MIRSIGATKRGKTLIAALLFGSVLLIESSGKFPLRLSTGGITRQFHQMSSKAPQPPQLPPRWTHTADMIKSEADRLIKEETETNDKIGGLSIDSIGVESAFIPYANFANENVLPVNQLTFYQHVSADKDLRDASTEASEKLEKHSIESELREDVYKAFNRLFELTKDSTEVDAQTKRFIEKKNKDFERNGLALSPEEREEIKSLQQKLSKLAITFNKNLGEQTEYLLFSEEELDGLPKEIFEQFEVVDGKYKVTYKYPDIIPTMKYAKNSETRKKLFLGDQNKVPENSKILEEAVKLRAELAHKLGYSTYSDYILEDRMAKTSTAVLDFLQDLKDKLTPLGLKDKERLLALKSKDLADRGLPAEDELYIWDSNFYNNMLLQEEYQIDAQKISEYFPMQHTVEKMLGIFEQLFNLKFYEVNSDSELYSTWHKDVKQFAVWKLDNPKEPEFVGWLYMDLYPREGKYGHAANFGIAPFYVKPDGSKSYSVTALVCNFSKPTKDKPSLLKHNEVTTFFHELGHGIHDLIGQSKYARFSGTSVSWDFVECPSQILEYWTWSPKELKELSQHYERTDETLPDDLIDSLNRSKHVNGGLFNLRQLFFGLYDMTLHNSKTGDVDLTSAWNSIREEVSIVANGGTVSKGYGSFGHLLGGYAAGYYGYMWSQVFATDIYYSKFKDDPMSRENGVKYRDLILARGGTMENMDMLEELLGRKPNSDAFLQELGVSSK